MSPRPLRRQRPEPSRAWIAYSPRRWPGPEGLWLDLAAGRVGSSTGSEDDLAAVASEALDDALYLPPVRADLRAARDRVAAAHRDRGTPVVVQVLPGEPAPGVPCQVVLDALVPVARGQAIPEGYPLVVWPLVPGRTVEMAWPLEVRRVLPFSFEAEPRELRRLAETLPDPDAGWDLFHRPPPAAAAALSRLRRDGIQPYLPRPLPDPPWPGRSNRFLAAALALAGELAGQLGEPASRSEAFLRAARFTDEAEHDLAVLARDGNLDVLPWLADEPRALVEWVLEAGEGVETWALWDWVEGRGVKV